MDNVISRFRNTFNLIVLAAVLGGQLIGLAVQVKRPEAGGTRLIRIWAISVVTPITRGIIHSEDWFAEKWHSYIWLRGVRQENERLRDEIAQIKMQQIRLVEDANQAHRLQLLLGFKEQYISHTVPAQVISTTGSEFSRAIYIDKGTNDGIQADMPVVTPEGIVGKVLRAFPSTSLVLLINDPTSGAGVILEKSRLQGILKGTASGSTMMSNVMSDEKVEVGERIVTSGGDRVFPKGLPVGTVATVGPGQDLFLNIRVKPAATLSRLEEVLVVTKIDERAPEALADSGGPKRAIDILAQRLPSVPPPAATDVAKPVAGTTTAAAKSVVEVTKPGVTPAAGTASAVKPKTTETAAVGTAPKPKVTDATSSTTAGTPKKTAAAEHDNPKPAKQAQTIPEVKPPLDTTKDTQPQ
ncbi:MAG TPA: rod shape-determining protein MreC [Terriglobales bacterium]|nr:rod shape-determining protein MreC [Terriglobales bacterium]